MPKAAASNVATIRRRAPRPARANGEATRLRILDTAERLFAEQGYAAVSLRQITATAGANVAAVHFHFASKEALFEAIFIRRVEPINRERLALLEAMLRTAPDGIADVEAIIRAYVEPHLRLMREYGPGGVALMQFMARAVIEPDPSIQTVLMAQFDPIWYRFAAALKRTLPALPETAIYWRFFHMIGALYYITPRRQWLADHSDGQCRVDDVEDACRQLVPFLVAGFCAGPPGDGPAFRSVVPRAGSPL